MKGLILAAGKGTRLRPLTFSMPKPLVCVANKPTIIYAIESFFGIGIKEIGIVVSEEYKYQFENSLMKYINNDINITFIVQSEAKGIAHAISCAKDFIGNETFIVQLGDNIIFHDYSSFISGTSKCKVLLALVNDITRFGIAEFKNSRIVSLVEKPKVSSSNLALVGLYLFDSEIFKFIDNLKPSVRGEYEITCVIDSMLKTYGKIDYEICSFWWKDTGTISDILEANSFILENVQKCNNTVDASSSLENTNLIKNVSIGSNCLIRNCNISNSIILDNVILNDINISDSIIGQDCSIIGSINTSQTFKLVLGSQCTVDLS
jgi:glucose-1-phosphate thymidylyltransferase